MTLFQKKNTDLTDITILLDASGSMQRLKSDTIGGFNNLLSEQKAIPGKASLTLIEFSTRARVKHDAIDIQDVPELTDASYYPGGNTALLDAVGLGIKRARDRIALMDAKPENVLFVIMTDGEENSSCEYKTSDIKDLITECQSQDEWNFVFLGAAQDAWIAAQAYGIRSGQTMSYADSCEGTVSAFASVGKGLEKLRRNSVSKTALASGSVSFFDDEDFSAQASLGVSNDQA